MQMFGLGRWRAGVIAAAVISMCVALMYGAQMPIGDDLSYLGVLTPHGGEVPYYGWPRLLQAEAVHWLTTNGRSANLIFFPLVSLVPHWLMAAIMGAATFAMTVWTARVADLCNSALGWIACILFTFWAQPWWDVMFQLVVGFSYPLACALSLLFVIQLMKVREHGPGFWLMTGLVLLSLTAGSIHEAAALPIMAGIAVYSLTRRNKNWQRWQLWMIAAYCLGLIFTLTSPTIWNRVDATTSAGGDIWSWLLPTIPIGLLAVIVVIVMLFFSKGRQKIGKLWRTPWIIWLTAAVVSIGIVALGATIGRSGWCGQTYAFIALCGLMLWPEKRGKILAHLVILVVVIQMAATTAVMFLVGEAERRAFDEYARSEDGLVRTPLPRQSELPWWTLGRVHVLDADDIYLLTTIQKWHRFPYPPVLCPPEAQIHPTIPKNAARIVGPDADGPVVYTFTTSDGGQMTATPYRGRYIVLPREVDPGD